MWTLQEWPSLRNVGVDSQSAFAAGVVCEGALPGSMLIFDIRSASSER